MGRRWRCDGCGAGVRPGRSGGRAHGLVLAARTKPSAAFAEYEAEEAVRLSLACHASILLGRTGCGLFTFGVAARWGEGGTCLESSVGSVPFDTEIEAMKAAFKELIAWL